VAASLAILVPTWLYDRFVQERRAGLALAALDRHTLGFTNNPSGSWRYSELIEDNPKGTTYFPTTTNEYAGATFRGYVTFKESLGLNNPATVGGPEIIDKWGNAGYQILTTWVKSDIDQSINLISIGDDGHALFVVGKFLGGAAFDGVVSNTLSLRANVPRKLTLAVYNSVGGWYGYLGLGPWNGLTSNNWSNLLNTVPGLSLNANGFPSDSKHPPGANPPSR